MSKSSTGSTEPAVTSDAKRAAAPIRKNSVERVDKRRSWSSLAVELLTCAAVLIGLGLIYELGWRLVEGTQIFLFTKHWLSWVLAVFATLLVGLLLEYRSLRLHGKFTYLTPFRLGLIIIVVSLFALVRTNSV